jgi:hypothetical protein
VCDAEHKSAFLTARCWVRGLSDNPVLGWGSKRDYHGRKEMVVEMQTKVIAPWGSWLGVGLLMLLR